MSKYRIEACSKIVMLWFLKAGKNPSFQITFQKYQKIFNKKYFWYFKVQVLKTNYFETFWTLKVNWILGP